MKARDGAYEVLEKIQTGAYANLALDQFLQGPGADLSRLDRNFLMELVQGTVKYRLYLDWIIDQLVQKPGQLKPGPRNMLRMGFYQLCFMDKIPARAATFETVSLAKRRFHSGVASLINGVLRSWLRDPEKVRWPDEMTEPAQYLSVTRSHPLWMVEDWLQRYGYEQTRFLCEYNNQPPELWLRTNTLRTDRPSLIEALTAQGCQVRPGQYAPESLELLAGPAIRELAAFQNGWFTIQDESSMLAAHGLAPQPGEQVLDTCAAPGGKTTHMAQLMQDQGRILAWDLHPHRVELIRENSRRLGIHMIDARAQDVMQARVSDEGTFQKILVDAPCSGLGVLRRRSDARWRKTPEEIRQLASIQKDMLKHALEFLAPGGRLLYSTCTIQPEENQLVVESVLKENIGFVPAPLPFEGLGFGSGSMLQCLPFLHGLEGFFMAAIERKES